MGSAPKKWFYYYAGRPAYRDFALVTAIVGLCFLFSSPGAAEAKSGPTTLSGATSQGQAANIRLSGSGGMITEASFTVQVRCSDGQAAFPMFLPEKHHLVPVKPGGTFKESVEGSDVDEDGTSVLVRETFTGRFNRPRTSVTAKMRLHLTLHAPDGTTLTCDSGVVRLHANS